MKDYEHQVQQFLNGCMDLVRIRPTLNQTQRCSAVRSYLFELINNLFELARERERERERERDESCVCVPASARLSLQAMWLSYFKNSYFTPSL